MKKFSILLVGISLFTGITQAQAGGPVYGSNYQNGSTHTPTSQYYTGGGYYAPTPETEYSSNYQSGSTSTHTPTPQYYTGSNPTHGGGYYAQTPAGTATSIYSTPGTAYPTGLATTLTRERFIANQHATLEAQKRVAIAQALSHRDQIMASTHSAMIASQETQSNAMRAHYEARQAAD